MRVRYEPTPERIAWLREFSCDAELLAFCDEVGRLRGIVRELVEELVPNIVSQDPKTGRGHCLYCGVLGYALHDPSCIIARAREILAGEHHAE